MVNDLLIWCAGKLILDYKPRVDMLGKYRYEIIDDNIFFYDGKKVLTRMSFISIDIDDDMIVTKTKFRNSKTAVIKIRTCVFTADDKSLTIRKFSHDGDLVSTAKFEE